MLAQAWAITCLNAGDRPGYRAACAVVNRPTPPRDQLGTMPAGGLAPGSWSHPYARLEATGVIADRGGESPLAQDGRPMRECPRQSLAAALPLLWRLNPWITP